jgi:hypothetical protein
MDGASILSEFDVSRYKIPAIHDGHGHEISCHCLVDGGSADRLLGMYKKMDRKAAYRKLSSDQSEWLS